jgi:hypothetical protein
MAEFYYFLAAIGIFGIIIFIMYMRERKEKKEAEILRKREEERREQVRVERAKRNYIEASEEYKKKELESFLKFEAGEQVYFYLTTHFICQLRVKSEGNGDKYLKGSVLLTNKQLIILNIDDIICFQTSEFGYIGLHFGYIHISVPGKDIYLDLCMRDIALIEKLAGKLNIKVQKADELINPIPDPDFDKEIEKYY